MSQKKSKIDVEPIFDRLVQPLDKDEKQTIMALVRKYPQSRVIKTWNGFPLEDLRKYEICRSMEIPVTFEEQKFDTWIDAAIHICRVQVKSKNIKGKYDRFLLGQLLKFQLMKKGDLEKAENKCAMEDALGKEINVTGSTIHKYFVYSEAINCVFEYSEDLARDIFLGKVNISHENIIELSHLKKEEIIAIAKTIKEEDVRKVSLSFIRNEVKLCHIQERGAITRKERYEMEAGNAGIRQMPKYDPDSEVNSLCMTMNSWTSTIQRVMSNGKLEQITDKASLRLMKELSFLEHTIKTMQDTLVERKDA